MNLLEKIDMFLLSEAKVSISPYLKSVMKKQDAFSDDDITKIIKKLKTTKTNAKISLAVSSPDMKKKYLTISKNSDDDIDEVVSGLKSLGYKINNTKKDGGIVYVYFE